MQRFRITLIAISFVLLYLGVHDLLVWQRNPAPTEVSIADLEKGPAQREWLTVKGGEWDLRQAISTSGSIEVEAYLVPLRSTADPQAPIHVMVETRNPEVVKLLSTYTFNFDSEQERQAFVDANIDKFTGRHDITGMEVSGLIASGNRDKLLSMARDEKMPVADNVVFISEGNTPPKFSGLFFTVMAVLGLGRGLTLLRRPRTAQKAESVE